MKDYIDLIQLQTAAQGLLAQINDIVRNPLFWIQFVVIAAVFVLARWLVTPLLRRGLERLAESCTRVPKFRRTLAALSEVANTIAWLALQWIAIVVASYLHWPSGALTVIASLLSAWLLIRLVTMLGANPVLPRFIAITAWTIAALNVFGLLQPVNTFLDSWSVNIVFH